MSEKKYAKIPEITLSEELKLYITQLAEEGIHNFGIQVQVASVTEAKIELRLSLIHI